MDKRRGVALTSVPRALFCAVSGAGVKATLRAAARALTPAPFSRPSILVGAGRKCRWQGLQTEISLEEKRHKAPSAFCSSSLVFTSPFLSVFRPAAPRFPVRRSSFFPVAGRPAQRFSLTVLSFCSDKIGVQDRPYYVIVACPQFCGAGW